MNESISMPQLWPIYLISFRINLREKRFGNVLILTVQFGATGGMEITLSILTVYMLIVISIVALEVERYFTGFNNMDFPC